MTVSENRRILSRKFGQARSPFPTTELKCWKFLRYLIMNWSSDQMEQLVLLRQANDEEESRLSLAISHFGQLFRQWLFVWYNVQIKPGWASNHKKVHVLMFELRRSNSLLSKIFHACKTRAAWTLLNDGLSEHCEGSLHNASLWLESSRSNKRDFCQHPMLVMIESSPHISGSQLAFPEILLDQYF